MAPPLTVFSNRLRQILEPLEWGEIRTGYEGTDVKNARDYPLCLITPADTPVVSQSMIAPARNADESHSELLTIEMWAIIVDKGATAVEAQEKVQEKANDVIRVLRRNTRLKYNDSRAYENDEEAGDTSETSLDGNPICLDSETHLLRRYVPGGELMDAMTVRIRISLVDVP